MRITYYGHSCFQVNIGGKNILFDPFISPNPLATEIDIKAINPDYILVSHAHNDHTADLVAIAKQSGAMVLSIWEIHVWLQKQGIEKSHPLNIGGSKTHDFGVVKMVSAVHSSSFSDGSPGGCAAGFYIESPEGNFYFAGDTALHYDMKLLGKYNHVDFAFLPIGNNFTMSVEDALIASKYIKCDKIIGMHYDTFGYIKIDHEEAIRKFSFQEKKLFLMTIGDSMDI